MRYQRIDAIAFGPFRDEKLELAPGMNVIHGRNETGKSSWHAALYAGLCGMRRARGTPRKEDQAFAERHRPWNENGDWEVGAVIELEKDECRVELRHDLARRTGSVKDADIAGRDYSNERMYDGAVDGSLWLGLNRQSFRATACVRQADILGVRESADFLQEALHKAAAGAPRDDATAAAALDGLKSYRKEHVGSPIAYTKPLSQAEAAVADRKAKRNEARKKRDDYRRRQARVGELGEKVRQRREEVSAVEAVLARKAADTAHGKLARARQLEASISSVPESPSPSEIAIATRVETALKNWQDRPVLTSLGGRSTDVVEHDIQTENRRIVTSRAVMAEREAENAERRLARALKLSREFPDGAPRPVAQDVELAASVNEALAVWRNCPQPVDLHGASAEAIGCQIETEDRKLAASRAVAAQHYAEEMEHRRARIILASRISYGGLVVVPIAVAVAAPNWLVAPALVLLPWVWWVRSKAKRMREQASTARKHADQLLDAADESCLIVARERNITPADIPRIEREHDNRRLELRVRLDSRVTAEQQRNRDLERVSVAEEELVRVAGTIGATERDPVRLAPELAKWLDGRGRNRAKQDRRIGQWGEYQGLLRRQSLEEVAEETLRKRERANDLLNNSFLGSAGEILAEARKRTSQELSELERRGQRSLKRLSKELDRSRGAEEQRRRDEAQLARAQAKLARVANDARVGGAEDPEQLASSLSEWLKNHKKRGERADKLQKLRDEFHRLVGELALSEFAAEVESLNRRARELAAPIDDAALANAKNLQPDSSVLDGLERRLQIAKVNLAEKRGRLQAFRETLIDVADAEDALAAAKREHERVVRLGTTLDRATEFLEKAEEKVFRTIAPILRSTLLEWLPRVTDRRYDDCRVNPETLHVEVRAARPGAPWHDASLLSHGTVEQIYLLLRLALSRHLGDRDESCPLILDDPVASSDASRKHAVLDTLHAIGGSVQVILFTHEDDVGDWARQRLSADARHRLIELPAVGG